MSMNLETWLRVAGTAHFGVLVASALTPKVLDWRTSLAGLHPFLRRLFWVYGAFIFLVILCFGLLACTQASALAAGSPLARGICAFVAVFWLARLLVQIFVFDARPFLSNRWLKVGYHFLTLGFIGLVSVFGWAAFN
jgi:hypothetical protein